MGVKGVKPLILHNGSITLFYTMGVKGVKSLILHNGSEGG